MTDLLLRASASSGEEWRLLGGYRLMKAGKEPAGNAQRYMGVFSNIHENISMLM